MKYIVTFLMVFTVLFSFSQEEDKAQLLAAKKANNFIYEGNALAEDEDFVSSEMAYRKALSEQPKTVPGAYNLGTTYYQNGNLDEALYRLQQATETASSKADKHKAFHNIGNILMKNKKCKEAVEAYKNALRNNPSDDETRYNLGVAKICAEEQKKQDDNNKDDKKNDQDKKDEEKENQDNQKNKNKEGDNNKEQDKKEEGEQDQKENEGGEDEKDKQDQQPKDEEKNKEKGDEDKKKEQQKPKPQPGQLSPQQIKNLLEAMNNQEQKVQEKINAEKQKGVKVKTDKDW
jgi:tetratricopeptide (TPR) repeat protein